MSQINHVRLIFNNIYDDLYCLYQNNKFRSLFLFGKEEDEYFVLDNPISETLSPWVSIIMNKVVLNKDGFEVEIKSYGLNAFEIRELNNLRQEAELAIKSKSNFDRDLYELFSPEKWHYKLE